MNHCPNRNALLLSMLAQFELDVQAECVLDDQPRGVEWPTLEGGQRESSLPVPER